MGKKVILSASTTSGFPTIGNYIGAISNWTKLQEEYECYYMVADLHSLTVRQDPKELKDRILSFFASYIACGLDPEKNVLFIQSQVSSHAELAWTLTCQTPMGELNRMTQFKDKSANTKEINTGLYCYPVLMASDILLYQTDMVPVGEDQKQHLELTRYLAEKFNNRYGQSFKIPEPYIPKIGARIMSLQDPTKKMSKSDVDPKSYVSLLDPPKKIEKKIKSAVTDSDPDAQVKFDEVNKAGISNLMTIYSVLTGKSFDKIEKAYEGKMYGHLKVDLAEIVVETLRPVREKHEELMNDKGYLESVIKNGRERAYAKASQTVNKVYENIGLPVIPST